MACNLVPLSDHARNDRGPCLARVVDCTFVKVDTGNEEGGFGIVCFELIQYVIGVDVRTVIVSNGDGVWDDTLVNAFSAVFLVSELGTRRVASAASLRN